MKSYGLAECLRKSNFSPALSIMSELATATSSISSLDAYATFAKDHADQAVSDTEGGVKTSLWGRLVHYWCPKQREPIIESFKIALNEKYDGIADFVFPETLQQFATKKGLTGSMIRQVIADAETKSAEAKAAATAKEEVESKKATLTEKIALVSTQRDIAANEKNSPEVRLQAVAATIKEAKNVVIAAEGLNSAARQLVDAAEAVGTEAYQYAIDEAIAYTSLAQTQTLVADIFCNEAAKYARTAEAASLGKTARQSREERIQIASDEADVACFHAATARGKAYLVQEIAQAHPDDQEIAGYAEAAALLVKLAAEAEVKAQGAAAIGGVEQAGQAADLALRKVTEISLILNKAQDLVSKKKEEATGWDFVDDCTTKTENSTAETSVALLPVVQQRNEEKKVHAANSIIPASAFASLAQHLYNQDLQSARSVAASSVQERPQTVNTSVNTPQKLGDSWVNVGDNGLEEEDEVFVHLEEDDTLHDVNTTRNAAETSEASKLAALALQTSKMQVARDQYDHVSQLLTQAQEEHYTILSDSYSLGRLYTQDRMLENFIEQPANQEQPRVFAALKALENRRQTSLVLLGRIKTLQGVLKTAVTEGAVIDANAINAEIKHCSNILQQQTSVKAAPDSLNRLKLHLKERYPRVPAAEGFEKKAPLETMQEETARVIGSFLQKRIEGPFVDWKTKVSQDTMLKMLGALKENERMAYSALETFTDAEALEQAVASSIITLKQNTLLITEAQDEGLKASAERDKAQLEALLVSVQEHAQKVQRLLMQANSNFNKLCKAKEKNLQPRVENVEQVNQELQEYQGTLSNLKKTLAILNEHQAKLPWDRLQSVQNKLQVSSVEQVGGSSSSGTQTASVDALAIFHLGDFLKNKSSSFSRSDDSFRNKSVNLGKFLYAQGVALIGSHPFASKKSDLKLDENFPQVSPETFLELGIFLERNAASCAVLDDSKQPEAFFQNAGRFLQEQGKALRQAEVPAGVVQKKPFS